MTRKKKVKKEDEEAKVHQELDGFDIKINSFGELESSIDINKLNTFLNENTEDKKIDSSSEEE